MIEFVLGSFLKNLPHTHYTSDKKEIYWLGGKTKLSAHSSLTTH